MKNSLFTVLPLVFFSVVACLAQGASTSSTKKPGPAITWESATHDFGDIHQGDKVEKTFLFTNTGNEPLIITNIAVTCGCTTPKGWPKDPIPPNGSNEITVAFNSDGKYGKQNKVVKVISNSVGNQNQVSFTANVLKREKLVVKSKK